MGAEYFKLALTCPDERLSSRITRGREAVTALLAGRLLDGGGPLYIEMCFLEMLLSEWADEVRLIEERREEQAHKPRSFWGICSLRRRVS